MIIRPPLAAEVQSSLHGCLLGTAVGDALGLPTENLSPVQIQKRWAGDWQMRLIFGRGMISDDTEHTLMVAQALLSHPRDPIAFQRELGRKLRWWLAGLPGGVGLATARAGLKLWAGFPASKSAVTSAGSGPAMRSAIIGVFFACDPDKRRAFTIASAQLTHRSWQSDTAALATSESAAFFSNEHEAELNSAKLLTGLRSLSPEREWQTILATLETALAANRSVSEVAQALGLENGITGYALHVVPVAIYASLRHPADFRFALSTALSCGGDTDTVGAILGGILGARLGPAGIPTDWTAGLFDWPRSPTLIQRIAERLAAQTVSALPLGPVRYCWPGIVPRNLFFLTVVLAHGLRRLAPPY